MSKIGYYILTEDQANLLQQYDEIEVVPLGGEYCVTDWQSVIDFFDDLIWEDGEVSDEEGEIMDILDQKVRYLYWSTEAHEWLDA